MLQSQIRTELALKLHRGDMTKTVNLASKKKKSQLDFEVVSRQTCYGPALTDYLHLCAECHWYANHLTAYASKAAISASIPLWVWKTLQLYASKGYLVSKQQENVVKMNQASHSYSTVFLSEKWEETFWFAPVTTEHYGLNLLQNLLEDITNCSCVISSLSITYRPQSARFF